MIDGKVFSGPAKWGENLDLNVDQKECEHIEPLTDEPSKEEVEHAIKIFFLNS